MEYILQLDPLDDITSMRSRIERVVATAGGPVPVMEATNIGRRRLLLVLPNHNKALCSLVNMKLLERAVQSKAVELGLVTDHPTVRDYAQVVGLKVFGSIRAAKRFDGGRMIVCLYFERHFVLIIKVDDACVVDKGRSHPRRVDAFRRGADVGFENAVNW